MAAPAVRVVPIAEADLETVAPLVNRAFAKYGAIWAGVRTSPSEYADEAGEDARVLLVEEGDRLLATAMVAPAWRFIEAELLGEHGKARYQSEADVPGSHPWAVALYFGIAGVEPETMSRGLGQLLLQHAEGIAPAEGYRCVALGTVREFGLVDYYSRIAYRVINEEEHPAGHWDFLVPHHYCEMVKEL